MNLNLSYFLASKKGFAKVLWTIMVIIIKFFTNQGANHRIRKKVRKIMGVDISESLIYIGVHHCICTQSRLKSKKVQFCLKG